MEVRAKKDFPIDWAVTQNNLANAYSDRILGDRAENLEKAIEAYQLALEVYTKKDLPIEWAMTQNNLGIAYSDRIRGDRAENVEKAIEAYQLALEVRQKRPPYLLGRDSKQPRQCLLRQNPPRQGRESGKSD